MPWTAAAMSTFGHDESRIVGFGASSSSIFDQTKLKTDFDRKPASRPRMMPIGR
jgi:hypothetical protein